MMLNFKWTYQFHYFFNQREDGANLGQIIAIGVEEDLEEVFIIPKLDTHTEQRRFRKAHQLLFSS